jgi:hypothetical protein
MPGNHKIENYIAVIQTAGGSKAGRGRKEKVNHEDLKGASAFAAAAGHF